MLFGPPLPLPPPLHHLTQYSSLPRRSGANASAASSSAMAFQRNTPVRRSTGIPENHIEYFVPRSISEFNLSGVGDLALPPPRRSPIEHSSSSMLLQGLQPPPPPQSLSLMGSSSHNMQPSSSSSPGGALIQQTILCGPTAAQPPPQQLQILMKPREKMVTFEDESNMAKGMGGGNGGSGGGGGSINATHCPHGVPTTPRKIASSNTMNAIGTTTGTSMSSGVGGIGTIAGSDVFM